MLNQPNGLAFYNGYLYVANYGANQVLSYTTPSNLGPPSLTLYQTITAAISSPTRLAFDANGFLYVTNAGNNTVTVYQPSVSTTNVVTTISGLSRPLGIAIDGSGHLYVANNATNSIGVYTGSPTTGFKLAYNLSQDAAGNQFQAPGVLCFDPRAGGTQVGVTAPVLLVGLGPTSGADLFLAYQPPLSSTSRPLGMLSNKGCATNPSGPTGICVNYSPSPYSVVLVSSYYNSSVALYNLTQIVSGDNPPCPTPLDSSTSKSNIARPEGVVLDNAANIYVSNSSANTITGYPGGGLGAAPPLTQR